MGGSNLRALLGVLVEGVPHFYALRPLGRPLHKLVVDGLVHVRPGARCTALPLHRHVTQHGVIYSSRARPRARCIALTLRQHVVLHVTQRSQGYKKASTRVRSLLPVLSMQ